MTAGDQSTWDEAIAQLGFHARPGHDWLDTLNRLWRKNRFVMSMDGVLKLPQEPPVLTRGMLSVSREHWPLERLVPLVHIDAHDRARPKQDDRPILLLEWQGRHFLIDGINRINRRKRDGLAGPHEVIVIHGRAPCTTVQAER
jgi:hypothetical protein